MGSEGMRVGSESTIDEIERHVLPLQGTCPLGSSSTPDRIRKHAPWDPKACPMRSEDMVSWHTRDDLGLNRTSGSEDGPASATG